MVRDRLWSLDLQMSHIRRGAGHRRATSARCRAAMGLPNQSRNVGRARAPVRCGRAVRRRETTRLTPSRTQPPRFCVCRTGWGRVEASKVGVSARPAAARGEAGGEPESVDASPPAARPSLPRGHSSSSLPRPAGRASPGTESRTLSRSSTWKKASWSLAGSPTLLRHQEGRGSSSGGGSACERRARRDQQQQDGPHWYKGGGAG